jgi:replicative DNA helicase
MSVLGQTENKKNDATDTSYQEESICGYVLSRVIQGQAPLIDFLTYEHFKKSFYGILYEASISKFKNGSRLSVADIVNDIFEDVADKRSIINGLNTLIRQSDMSFEIIKGFAFDLDERFKCVKIRELLRVASDSMTGYKHFGDIVKDITVLHDRLNELTYVQSVDTDFEHEDMMDNFFDNFYKDEQPSISSGLIQLDNLIGGFANGELIIIGGRPGMGKTALCVHIVGHAAEAGYNILNFALEMTPKQNSSRFASMISRKYCQSGVSYKNLFEGKHKVSNDLVEPIRQKVKEIKLQIKHSHKSPFTVDGIINYAEQHSHTLKRENKRLDMIVIDYLQIISMGNKRDAHLEIGDVTGKLKQLAKKLNIPVILLSQLNRESEKEKTITSKRPSLTHLRQSGKIEEDADKVLLPFRPSYYEKNIHISRREWDDDYMEIIVAKNRMGDGGTAQLKAEMSTNYFYDEHDYHNNPNAGLTPHGISKKESSQSNKKSKETTEGWDN